MSRKFVQEVNSFDSMLNPRNGFIVGDILGIIEPMSLFPRKVLENWSIYLSNKDLTFYKEKFEEDYLSVNSDIFDKTWRFKKIKEVDGEEVCVFSFEVFYRSCRMVYHGLDFDGFKEYIKGIGLEIIRVENTMNCYEGRLGRNVDISGRPKFNYIFCHGPDEKCGYMFKRRYMSMKCRQIYLNVFIDGRYTITVIDKGFDILGFVRYLHGFF